MPALREEKLVAARSEIATGFVGPPAAQIVHQVQKIARAERENTVLVRFVGHDPPDFEFGPTVVWPLKSSARTLSSRDFGIFCLFPARCFLVRVALPWVCVMPRIASRAGYARVPSATGRGCAKQLWRVRARQLSPPGVCRIKTFVSRNTARPRNSSVPWQARQSSQSHG